MDKVKTGFTQESDDELAALIAKHTGQMVGNANFPTPMPSVAEFAAGTDPFVAAVKKVNDLNEQLAEAMLQRDGLRPAAEQYLMRRAAYVQSASGGSGAIILDGGFELAKPHAGGHGRATMPLAPTSLAVTMGSHNQALQALWHAAKGCSWIIQLCDDPLNEANFKQVGITSRSSFDITGLVSGQKYWVRIAAVKSGVQGDWSSPVVCMAP